MAFAFDTASAAALLLAIVTRTVRYQFPSDARPVTVAATGSYSRTGNLVIFALRESTGAASHIWRPTAVLSDEALTLRVSSSGGRGDRGNVCSPARPRELVNRGPLAASRLTRGCSRRAGGGATFRSATARRERAVERK